MKLLIILACLILGSIIIEQLDRIIGYKKHPEVNNGVILFHNTVYMVWGGLIYIIIHA